jgi:DNA-binding GntR family transcriptional regulator
VVSHLADAIVSGAYAPGTPLPEEPLARELGTSRGTVREALRALDDFGLVEIVPHRGAAVSRVTRKRARDVFDLRAALEAFAARDAVEKKLFRHGVEKELRRVLKRLEEAVRENAVYEVVEAERELHNAIASASDNELLVAELLSIHRQTYRVLAYYRPQDFDLPGELEDHRRLVETLLTADPLAAEREARDHVLRARDRVLANMPEIDEA